MPSTIIAAIALVATLATSALAQPGEPAITWLDDHAVPIATCEAGHGLDDLAALAAMIGHARIVGLGEATHGTREHFQMKHRLVEYLVEQLGFTWFAIEASTPEAHRLDAWVLGGEGDPAALIGGMYFWTWNTQEVLNLVRWMRDHNTRSERKVRFTGFDMQTPDVAADEVVAFLERIGSPLASVAAARYARIRRADGGSSFATATYRFPVELARGKTVRFGGWIRTADLHDGFAGLWWRVDGPAQDRLAFNNMADRAINGTTDWTWHEFSLPVAPEATNINFGFFMSGSGTAWFDDARIELDGEVVDPALFDLDFESTSLGAGFATNDVSYTTRLVRDVAHGGAQSLRLSALTRDPNITANPEAVLADMLAERERWLATYPGDEVERAILYARIVTQSLRQRASAHGGFERDEAMAENVAWLAEQNPSERLVLWAHNYHVSRAPGAMGSHLARRFGDEYLPVGFATASGRYHAIGKGAEREHDLQPPPPGSFEQAFAAAGAPRFVLDLRHVAMDHAGSAWFGGVRPLRSIGAMASDQQFFPTPLRAYYDLLVFVRDTTPARQLATPPARSAR